MVGKRFPPQEGDRVPIYLYRPGTWERETLSCEPAGVLHAIHPLSWDGSPRQQLLTASFLGLHRFEFRDGKWEVTHLSAGDPGAWPQCGSSEVRMGHLGQQRFLATIEPWHGNQVVVYVPQEEQWPRRVIEDQMQNGHALAVGDLDGDGNDEIVCGFRGQGHTAVHLPGRRRRRDTLAQDGAGRRRHGRCRLPDRGFHGGRTSRYRVHWRIHRQREALRKFAAVTYAALYVLEHPVTAED